MDLFTERSISFFIDNMPTWDAIVIGGPLGLLWATLCLFISGWLKKRKGLKTGYTRKVFHILIFSSVATLHLAGGTAWVCLFGGMTTLVIFYAVVRGPGNFFYEAIAREKDAPHRTYYIVAPYFATLIGGLASNIILGQMAVIGYLVTGLGDAVGEPVGTRFGKHTYKVFSVSGAHSTRSYEGSVGVFLACVGAISIGVFSLSTIEFSATSFLTVPLLGILCALIEGITPCGWDNAAMMILPPLLAGYLF